MNEDDAATTTPVDQPVATHTEPPVDLGAFEPLEPLDPIEFDAALVFDDVGEPVREVATAAAAPLLTWPETLVVVWIVGTLLCASTLTWQARRFRRVVRSGQDADPALAKRVRRLADRLGLRRVPRVIVVDATVSPAVWTAWPASRLVLPARLLEQLAPAELDSILLHELAHAARRDHWVRPLECAAMCIYWWLPLLWWFRRELRDAEEQSCDALVVRVLGEPQRVYADALIKTVMFLNGAPRCALPGAATGAAQALTRRLTMIMDPRSRPVRRNARIGLAAAALLMLPIAPTRAQDVAAPPEPPAVEARPSGRLLPPAAPTATAYPARVDLTDRELAVVRALESMRDSIYDGAARRAAGSEGANGFNTDQFISSLRILVEQTQRSSSGGAMGRRNSSGFAGSGGASGRRRPPGVPRSGGSVAPGDTGTGAPPAARRTPRVSGPSNPGAGPQPAPVEPQQPGAGGGTGSFGSIGAGGGGASGAGIGRRLPGAGMTTAGGGEDLRATVAELSERVAQLQAIVEALVERETRSTPGRPRGGGSR